METTHNLSPINSVIEEKWNHIYKQPSISQVSDILINNSFLLPQEGCALDLACGLGANALFLAKNNLKTHAWDISATALSKLNQNAKQKNLAITTKQVNIEPNSLPKNTFDVIIVSRYLDRILSNAIMESLKHHGLLFYHTFVQDKINSSGPNNPDYLLAKNELLQLFQPLSVVMYKENSLIGNLKYGYRDEAFFIGQKS